MQSLSRNEQGLFCFNIMPDLVPTISTKDFRLLHKKNFIKANRGEAYYKWGQVYYKLGKVLQIGQVYYKSAYVLKIRAIIIGLIRMSVRL